MKRQRDPSKKRRKFGSVVTRSPGQKLLAANRRRMFSIDPAGSILEQIERMFHGKRNA